MQTAASSEKTKPSPFGTSFQLEKTSVSSSVSESCRHETVQTVRAGSATSSSHSPLCSCGSLTEWSSLQLQEEHLLGVNRKNGQDMVVVVLTRTDNEASPQLQEKQGTACKVAAADKQKSRLSLGGHSARSSTGGISVAQGCCAQNPRQLTQEVCLRLLALLLVVVATVGLAYRLAKRGS